MAASSATNLECPKGSYSIEDTNAKILNNPAMHVYAMKAGVTGKYRDYYNSHTNHHSSGDIFEFVVAAGDPDVGILVFKDGCTVPADGAVMPSAQAIQMFQDAGIVPDDLVRINAGA